MDTINLNMRQDIGFGDIICCNFIGAFVKAWSH